MQSSICQVRIREGAPGASGVPGKPLDSPYGLLGGPETTPRMWDPTLKFLGCALGATEIHGGHTFILPRSPTCPPRGFDQAPGSLCVFPCSKFFFKWADPGRVTTRVFGAPAGS